MIKTCIRLKKRKRGLTSVYGRALILTWSISFALSELAGVGLAYLLYGQRVSEALSGCVADIVIVAIRFLSLVYIGRMTGVGVVNAIYKPLPPRRSALSLPLFITFTALLDYLIVLFASGGTYEPQLLGYRYYVEHGLPWGLLPKVAYYLSEIVVLNYMYILANMTWKSLKPPLTAGTFFLMVGWAALHVITKNLLVALYAIALVLMFYSGYEYTKSPATPIILWFTVLLV